MEGFDRRKKGTIFWHSQKPPKPSISIYLEDRDLLAFELYFFYLLTRYPYFVACLQPWLLQLLGGVASRMFRIPPPARLPIKTPVATKTSQSLYRRCKRSTTDLPCGDRETPRGHFHVFLAELFLAILWNIHYCKPNEKTLHLSVIQGPASSRVFRMMGFNANQLVNNLNTKFKVVLSLKICLRWRSYS